MIELEAGDDSDVKPSLYALCSDILMAAETPPLYEPLDEVSRPLLSAQAY